MQVGFCTLYTFWAYPNKTRLRVSQILVLPPHQRQGVGQALLQAAYALADQRGVLDVQVSLFNMTAWPGECVRKEFTAAGCLCPGRSTGRAECPGERSEKVFSLRLCLFGVKRGLQGAARGCLGRETKRPGEQSGMALWPASCVTIGACLMSW